MLRGSKRVILTVFDREEYATTVHREYPNEKYKKTEMRVMAGYHGIVQFFALPFLAALLISVIPD